MNAWEDLSLDEQRRCWKRHEVFDQSTPQTPCEAAYRNAAHRRALLRWLDAGESAGRWIVFEVVMPGRVERTAHFRREVRRHQGKEFHAAVDPRTRTVFHCRPVRPVGSGLV
jgi:hypothetical protein